MEGIHLNYGQDDTTDDLYTYITCITCHNLCELAFCGDSQFMKTVKTYQNTFSCVTFYLLVTWLDCDSIYW